jgi:hypothetical protein
MTVALIAISLRKIAVVSLRSKALAEVSKEESLTSAAKPVVTNHDVRLPNQALCATAAIARSRSWSIALPTKRAA